MKLAGIYDIARERKSPQPVRRPEAARCHIAGVVAMRPDCPILDEATAMLDPLGREQVMHHPPPEQEHYGHHGMSIHFIYWKEAVCTTCAEMSKAAMWDMEGNLSEEKRCLTRPKRRASCDGCT